MDVLILLCAPNVRPSALATALHAPPSRAADATWDLAAILRRLREETERCARLPARPWTRPEPPPWVEATLADFSPLLIRNRFATAEHIVLLHPSLALDFAEIRGWLPGARWALLLRGGLFAGTAAPPASASPAEAACAGLQAAAQWAAHVGPALQAHLPAFSADPISPELAALLGVPRLAGWRPPPPAAPLTGAAAAGFACHPAARRWMAHIGQPLPAPPAELVRDVPALAAAVASGLEEPSAAHALLRDALRRHPESALLWAGLGDLLAAQQDEAEAVRCWLAALRRPQPPLEAWLRLLSCPQRPETLAIAGAARVSAEPRIREAAARWMVARGLDPEAAEVLADVHGRRWYGEDAQARALHAHTWAA